MVTAIRICANTAISHSQPLNLRRLFNFERGENAPQVVRCKCNGRKLILISCLNRDVKAADTDGKIGEVRDSKGVMEAEGRFTVGTYARAPVVLASGDVEGREYLDMTSGIAVNALGYCDPCCVQAVVDQANVSTHDSNVYHSITQVELAKRPVEADEAAMKFARKFQRSSNPNAAEPATKFVAFSNDFHGRTLGALALTSKEQYRSPFEPLMPGVNIDAARKSIQPGKTTAAVFVEPIQGEGGIYSASATKELEFLRASCDDAGAPLVFDEITALENLKSPESCYEGGKLDNRNIGLPPVGPSLVAATLQIIKNEDLEELRQLGSGAFGTVYHGKWRGSDVAIKRLKKTYFTGQSSQQERLTIDFWHEAEILSKLHHPNIVAFYGVAPDGPGGTLATVTEYMVDGSLRHVLRKKDRYLDHKKRLLIAMDAAFGMEYLHSKNIVHFDLKCDNLLVNLKDPQRPICKVGDFGLSKIKRNTLVSGGARGTIPWMAKELLNGTSNKVSEKVDVFSFGIVLWEILTGEVPYANLQDWAIIGGIVNDTLRPAIPNFCDPDWKRLMEECWAPDPASRPSFTEIAGRLRTMS